MTTRGNAALDRALAQLFGSSTSTEVRLGLLADLRQQRPDLSPRIDEVLLQRDQMQGDAIRELGGIVEELRQTTTKLTRPPLHEAVFVESRALPDGRMLARVVGSGSRELLVELVDESILPTLQTGDRVLLAAEGNAVLGKAEARFPEAGECAVVERWLGNERLVLRHRDQAIVTCAAANLTPANLATGETVRLDALSGFAMERVPPAETSPYAPEDEATSLSPEALAGYDDLRDEMLRKISYPVAHPAVAARYALCHRRPSILVGGPPGVGKTTLARVVAGELQRQTGRRCRIRKLNGAELTSPYVGETEQRIRAFMREIRDSDEWTIVFIDEAEAIARTRGTLGNVHQDRFLNSWLAELEGFDGRAPCILIAASNRLDMLDPAFRARFATEVVVPRPRMDAARAIFAHHLGVDLPYHPGGDAAHATRRTMIEAAVAKLCLPNAPGALLATLRFRDGKARSVFARDLLSGRLIEQVCVEARERAFARHVEGDACGLRSDDIDHAVDSARERLRTTLTPSNAHSYLDDIPRDVAVVAVDPAPRIRGGVTFLHEVAR